MGKAPVLLVDGGFSNGFELKSEGSLTATVIGDKIYVISGSGGESASTFGVRVLTKSTGAWTVPKVLGTKPNQCKSHWAVLLDEERILVVRGGSTLDDCAWFLEVDTKFIRQQRNNFDTEVVAWSKGVRGDVEKPIVISGPSGVGKGTLISKLMGEFPDMFGFSVSHTTRAPRNKEKDGVHYHFTDLSVMEKDIEDGKFLESAKVHGNLYGTSVEAVEAVADAGKICILDIDVQGAESVRSSSFEAIFIFISPPSFEELQKRLFERGTETEEQIQERLQNARTEVEQGQSPGRFDHILINDNLETCYEDLKKLLGLDGRIGAAPKSLPRLVDLPMVVDHLVWKIDRKILINCATAGPDKTLVMIDSSLLRGGAPGRTKGLDMNTVEHPVAKWPGQLN